MYRLALFLLFLVAAVTAADPAAASYARQYTTSDGLPSPTVYHVFSDSRGYLWFATDKGISKFDGRTFMTYSVLDGLSDNVAFNFFEDRWHNIWPFTFNGKYSFIQGRSVQSYRNNSLLTAIPPISYINAMCYDPDSALYLGYITGDVIRIKDNKPAFFFRHREGDGLISSIVSENGVLNVYGEPMWRCFRNGRLVAEENHGHGNTFYYNQTLFVTDSAGIATYRNGRRTWSVADPRLAHGETIHIYGDTTGRVFCSTKSGLYVVDTHTGAIRRLLAGQKVSCCIRSSSGDYWATTLGNGVWRINGELEGIQELGESEPLKIAATDRKTIFMAGQGRLYVPDGSGRRVTVSALPFKADGPVEPLVLDSNLFVYNDLRRNRLCFYNLATHALHSDPYCRKIGLSLPGHQYLISGSQRLAQYYFDGRRFSKLWEMNHRSRAIRMLYNPVESRVYTVQEDTLSRFDPATHRLHGLIRSPLLKTVSSIHRIGDYLFFISGSPAILFCRTGNPAATLRDIPIANIIYRISGISDSAALFNTQQGDYLVSLTAGSFRIVKILYPFAPYEYDDVYPLGNHFLFSLNGGFYVVNQALLNKTITRPVLIPDEMTVNGTRYSGFRDITLRRTDHCELNVTAGTLYFRGPRNVIQYRIIDKDTNSWHDVEASRVSIMFSEYGSYNIQLRAMDVSGLSSPVRTFSLTLTPPFYRTGTCYVIVVLLLAGAAVFLLRRFNERRRKAFQNELNYLKMEHRSVNSLLNPHFVFNVINNIQGLVNTGSKELASNYLAVMSTLIRQNIENLQFNLISIDRELHLVRHYIELQNLRVNHMIALRIDLDDAALAAVLIPPLLIHTFVENAVLHGFRDKAAQFHIGIEITADSSGYLLIRITDNGAGLLHSRPEQALKDKTSLGISFNKKRLGRISAFYKLENSISIADRSARGEQGTEVNIILYSRLQDFIQS